MLMRSGANRTRMKKCRLLPGTVPVSGSCVQLLLLLLLQVLSMFTYGCSSSPSPVLIEVSPLITLQTTSLNQNAAKSGNLQLLESVEDLCGSSRAQCGSLHAAVQTAHALRYSPGAYSLYTGQGSGNAHSVVRLNDTVAIHIVLMADARLSDCRILASPPIVDPLGNRHGYYASAVHISVSNLVIRLSRQHSGDCSHAKLYWFPNSLMMGTPGAESARRLISIQSTSVIVLERVAILEHSAPIYKPSVLIDVHDSTAILFHNVLVHLPSPYRTAIRVQSSRQVNFINCTVTGSRLNNTPYFSIFEDRNTSVAVNISVSGESSRESLSPVEERALRHWLKLISCSALPAARSRSSWKDAQTIIFCNCTFEHLGEGRATSNQRTASISATRAIGVAINLNMDGAIGQSVLIEGCTFHDNITPFGSALVLQFPAKGGDAAVNCTMNVTRCEFTGNVGTYGSAVLAILRGKSRSNTLSITDSEFRGNTADFDGSGFAVFFRFDNSERRNKVYLTRDTFVDNRARTLGCRTPGSAVLVRSTDGSPEILHKKKMIAKDVFVSVHMHACTLSGNGGNAALYIIGTTVETGGVMVITRNSIGGVMLSRSYLRITGSMSITNNTGFEGGGIHLALFSIVDARLADHFIVSGNSAVRNGDGLFAGETTSSATQGRILLERGRKRSASSAFCPVLFPNNAQVRNESIWSVLFGNMSPRSSPFKVSAVFMASLMHCFDVFKPYLSKVFGNGRGSGFAQLCYCPPYVPAAWENYGAIGKRNENITSDKLYAKLLNGYLTHPDFLEVCLARSGPADYIPERKMSMNSSIGNDPMRSSLASEVCYSDHSGQQGPPSLDPASMQEPASCEPDVVNRQFRQPTHCYSRRQDMYVTNYVSNSSSTVLALGTLPSWLFFNTATTSCYKTIGDKVWYFKDLCKRGVIVDEIKRHRKPLPLATDCYLFRLAFLYHSLQRTSTPILPGYRLVLTPWASTVYQWYNRNIPHEACQQDSDGERIVPESSISSIVLHPAPGEEFNLKVTVADEVFNDRPTTVSLQVAQEETHSSVLMKIRGHTFQPEEPATFSSHLRFSRISLLGAPGTKGMLVVTVLGNIAIYQLGVKTLSLEIPFVLRQCHLGFEKMTMTQTEAQRRIIAYTSTPRSANVSSANTLQQMTCQCATSTPRNFCIHSCRRGRHAEISKRCWAGDTNLHTYAFSKEGSFTEHNATWFFGQPDSEPPLHLSEQEPMFAAAQCSTPECMLKNTNASWSLGQQDPCTPQCNCGGVLCTRCKVNYTLLSDGVCVNCETAKVKISLPVYFLIQFLGAGILLAVLLVLNIGMCATLDSWFFFMQVFFFVSGSNSWDSIVAVRRFLTLGLGSICFSKFDMTSQLNAVMCRMAIPIMLPLLTFLLWCAARRGHGLSCWKRLMKRNSIVHVFWLVILCSTAHLPCLCFLLLRCVPLTSQRQVLYLDGYVECYSRSHLPYMLSAILVLVLICLPVPILLVWRPLHLCPALKVFIDEATHIYEDDRQWWVGINYARRLILSMSSVLIVDLLSRRMASILFLCVYVALHAVCRPLRRDAKLGRVKDFNNVYELLLLLLLIVLGILQVVKLDIPRWHRHDVFETRDWLNIVLFSLVTLFTFSLITARLICSWCNALSCRRGLRSGSYLHNFYFRQQQQQQQRS
eukprot:scpid11529/ scgid5974/ 